jgi:hypothetical protein
MFGGVIQTKGKEWMTSMPPLPHFAAQSTYLGSNYPLLTRLRILQGVGYPRPSLCLGLVWSVCRKKTYDHL